MAEFVWSKENFWAELIKEIKNQTEKNFALRFADSADN